MARSCASRCSRWEPLVNTASKLRLRLSAGRRSPASHPTRSGCTLGAREPARTLLAVGGESPFPCYCPARPARRCTRPATPPLLLLVVVQAFPSINEEQLALLLPGKSGLVQTKLSNRCVVYSQEGGNPLFFDPDGRGGLLPTASVELGCA